MPFEAHFRIFLLSNGPVVKALDCQSRGSMFKTLGGSKVDSGFQQPKVDEESAIYFWKHGGKK